MQTVQVVLGISLLTLGVVCGYGILRAPQTAQHIPAGLGQPSEVTQGQAEALVTLDHDLSRLREELKMLQHQQTELRDTLPTLQPQPGERQTAMARRRPQQSTGARKRRGETPAASSRTDQTAAVDDVQDRPVDPEAQRAHVRHELQAFEERLAAEAPDAGGGDWATQEIERALAERDLQETSLMASECAETLCRFEFAFENLQGRDASLGLIPFVLPTAGGGVWFMDPDEPLRLIFFAERTARSG